MGGDLGFLRVDAEKATCSQLPTSRVSRRAPSSAARLAVPALLVSLVLALPARAEAPVQAGSAMKHLDNRTDPGLGLSWTADTFDDSSWSTGTCGVAFDDSGAASELLATTVPSGASSIYSRTRATIYDVMAVHSLFIGAHYDDAFVAWINGAELHRSSQTPAGASPGTALPGRMGRATGACPATARP